MGALVSQCFTDNANAMGLLTWFQFSLLLCSLPKTEQQGIPEVFQDYFNEEVKVVDISQKVALEACLSSSWSLLDKIEGATKNCLGKDKTFDWDDFDNINTGSDTDDNGLTIKMENAEACFYKGLGWLNNQGDNVNKDAILEDLDNLKDASIKQTFNKDINLCINWNGKFGPSRMKRSAEDPTEEFGVLGLAKTLSRQRRQFGSGKGNGKGKGKGGKGGKGGNRGKVGKGGKGGKGN